MSGRAAQTAADEAGQARADPREALALTALVEFANAGLAATPLARILQKAGARNSSALHYHFGSKDGLIRHLVGVVQDAFDRERDALLARLSAQPQVSVGQALEWLMHPYVTLIAREPWGLAAVRFVALIQFERNVPGLEALREGAAAPVEQLYRWIDAATGEGAALKPRLLFFVDAVIQGFAARDHLQTSFLGDMRFPDVRAQADFYVTCGLRLFDRRTPSS